MTSYRGVEAIDCVGMPAGCEGLGPYCGNLKPNRFWELNENAFKGLACARLSYFLQRIILIVILFQCNIYAVLNL